VLLVRRASAGLISTQLRVSQGELEALSEEIRLFDAAVRKEASGADENPEKAKQRRGDGAEPRTRVQLSRADENPEKAKQRRGDGAKPRTKATLSRADENPEKAKQRRGDGAEPRTRVQLSREAGGADENPEKAKKRRGESAEPRTKATLGRVGDWERVVEVGLADREKNHARAAASHTSLSGLI
jgi:hypothetical protein